MTIKNSPINKPVVQDDPLTRKVIACAIEVHKQLWPGLLEKLYQEAMVINFNSKMVKDGVKRFVL